MNKIKTRLVFFVLVFLILIGCSQASSENAGGSAILANGTLIPATPFITMDPIENHSIGDVFFINGTTNLPVSDNLTITIVYLPYIRQTHPKSDLGPPITNTLRYQISQYRTFKKVRICGQRTLRISSKILEVGNIM